MSDGSTTQVARRWRPQGFWVLLALIVLGMGIPAFFRWQAVKLKAEREELLAASPSEPEARLAQWLRFGGPLIHQALENARYSDERPWFVTHVVLPANESELPEVHGIDFTDLPHEVVFQDGMVVRVVLDAPRLLERARLTGDKAEGVAVFQPGVPVPDPRRLALDRLVPYLRIESGLARDIPAARLVVEVGGLNEDDAVSDEAGGDER